MKLIKILFIFLFLTIFFTMSSFADDTIIPEDTSNGDINKTDDITKKYGFTLAEERALGFQYAVLILKKYGYFYDSKVNNYVNEVGLNLVKHVTKRPDVEYHFFALDSMKVNGFALPGGYIFVTKGLLSVLANEAELAGVLAKLIAHVELGHNLEGILIHEGYLDSLNRNDSLIFYSECKDVKQHDVKTLLNLIDQKHLCVQKPIEDSIELNYPGILSLVEKDLDIPESFTPTDTDKEKPFYYDNK